jgi:hypothetical protein
MAPYVVIGERAAALLLSGHFQGAVPASEDLKG